MKRPLNRWKLWQKRSAKVVAVTLAAYGAGEGAVGQEGHGHDHSHHAPISQGVVKFNIPAGQMDEALRSFESQSGSKVNLKVPAETLAGFRTKGISGMMSAEQALRALLGETGLGVKVVGDSAFEIGVQNSEQVDVTTQSTTVALTQFTQPLLDTAQTVNVIPQYIMQEQQVTTLRDTLRNSPGISIAAGEGGAQGDNLTIRGFSARNDMFLDGIRDFGSYYRDAFDYEQVAVLQGPASVQFGRGSTGGVINQETKQPQTNQFARGSLQLGTNLMRRVTGDINVPLQDTLEGAAFRLNVVGSQSKVAQRDYAEKRRFGIAPSLIFGLNSPTRFSLNYLHEGENSTPDYGLPYFGPRVAQVNRKNYYGFANDNFLRTNPDVVTAKVEHDIGTRATLRNVTRWGNYPRNVVITEPQILTAGTLTAIKESTGKITGYNATCAPTNATACYPVTTPLRNVQVTRAQIPVNSTEDIIWNQTSAVGHFSLGHIENDAVIMAEGGRERSMPQRTNRTVGTTNALNPTQDVYAATYVTPPGRTHITSWSYGIGFNDTMKLTQWLMLSGGVRFDHFETQSDQAATVNGVVVLPWRVDDKPTYRAAAVVKPRPNGSVYFDWGTSFNPSAESLSLSANNATQAPQENETYEAGAKWAFMRDRLNVNGAYFRTTKSNVYETDPFDTTQVRNVGNQRIQGVQFGVLGHLPQHFDILAGYAYLSGRVTATALNASPFATQAAAIAAQGDAASLALSRTAPFYINPVGMPFANVPKNTGNLWVTHDIGWGFVGGFGSNYTAARRASTGALIAVYDTTAATNVNNVRLDYKAIPDYWIFSAMVRKPLSDRLDFQANLNNLGNKFYIDQPHPNHLIPGEGFNAQFGFNMKF